MRSEAANVYEDAKLVCRYGIDVIGVIACVCRVSEKSWRNTELNEINMHSNSFFVLIILRIAFYNISFPDWENPCSR